MKYDLEFWCQGCVVGCFVGPDYPTRPGLYHYELYRGIGHYEMGVRLEKYGRANCYYLGDKPMQFTVVAEPQDDLISLTDFKGGTPPPEQRDGSQTLVDREWRNQKKVDKKRRRLP
jgi:hypothetical protein